MARKNWFGSLLVKIYVVLRGEWNPIVNDFLSRRFIGIPQIDFEEKYKEMPAGDFKNESMKSLYKSDPAKGAFDFTFLDPKFFFWDELPYGRDCDDFSYMWYLWARFNNQLAYQYVVVPNIDIKKSHAVTVTSIGGHYILYDYADRYTGISLVDVMSQYFRANYDGKENEKEKPYTSISYAKLRDSEDIETIRERLI